MAVMVLEGVPTRKIAHITEELYVMSFSKSAVYAVCKSLDALLWMKLRIRPRTESYLIIPHVQSTLSAVESIVAALKSTCRDPFVE